LVIVVAVLLLRLSQGCLLHGRYLTFSISYIFRDPRVAASPAVVSLCLFLLVSLSLFAIAMGNCFSFKKSSADKKDPPGEGQFKMSITTQETMPFEGQKPGTSGISTLRPAISHQV
jgi:hypothetical protein